MSTDIRSVHEEIAAGSRGMAPVVLHKRVLARLDAHPAPADVLDFGAGGGTLTGKLLRRPGIGRVVAADLVSYEDAPGERLVCDLNDPVPLPAESFDAVVAVGVIEYLENGYAVAREWHRLLRPGGIAVLTVPNRDSLRSLASIVLRGSPLAFAAATASYAYGWAEIGRILSRAGFVDLTVAGSGWGLVPGAGGLTWQRLSFGVLDGMRFSDDLVCSALKPR